jgi:hypothetical protein
VKPSVRPISHLLVSRSTPTSENSPEATGNQFPTNAEFSTSFHEVDGRISDQYGLFGCPDHG